MIKLLKWFVSTKAWYRLARHTIAHFTFRTFGYPHFPMIQYFNIVKAIAEDIDAVYAFVSADKDSLAWKLSRIFTRGIWGHAGIVVWENGHPIVYHMKGTGLNCWHLLDILRECDHFALVKLAIPKDKTASARGRLEKFKTYPLAYDFQLELNPAIMEWLVNNEDLPAGNDPIKLYCSEFVLAIGTGLVTNSDFAPIRRMGQNVFEPDHVYKYGGSVVFEH